MAVQFPPNPTSEMSADEKNLIKDNRTMDQSDESGHEIESDIDEVKEKKFLDDAMKTVLDPSTIIQKTKDAVELFKFQLEELDRENLTVEGFMDEMDRLSLAVCKTSQEALWSYVTDINNEGKKNKMVSFMWTTLSFLVVRLHKKKHMNCVILDVSWRYR